ncbi:TolC family protein [Brasilonema octagenarum UFV-E1]|uniref:TolC family protein n=1 Tax=Brasilonema sennae CENA114 TaxID=415709 RepID=A0A856MGL5_9CYAN|nr:TolC family protein [Brasilonema sennae]QDL10363.1 TolC family protein [Brasilonema sennae CENA114]QDL16710.1 TolC family protein [Brasilonema octagenarum UFV-E1]
MNKQQIFSSFLPGVTAAVLATQSAWANPVPARGVKVMTSSDGLTSTFERTPTALDIKKAQLPHTASSSFLAAAVPTVDVMGGGLISSITRSGVEVILTGKTGVPVAKVAHKLQSMLMSFKSTPNQSQLINKIPQSGTSIQKQNNDKIVAEESKNTFSAYNEISTPTSTVEQKTPSSGQVPTEKKSSAQLPNKSQTPVRGTVEVAKLLEQMNSCPQQASNGKSQVGRSASVLLKSSTCSQQNTKKNLVAQASSSKSQGTTPGRITQAGSSRRSQTTPAQTTPAQTTPAQTTPAPADSVQLLNNLKANPNPLQFPTKSEEVRIQGTQPITLTQALEIARQNNQDLQISLLTVERNRASVRQAQAALLPTAGLTAGLSRTGPAFLNQQQANSTGTALENVPSTTNFQGSASVQYDLYTSGQTTARIRQAEEQLRFYELDVERQSEEIRLNVTSQYYDLQAADEQVRIAQSAVRNGQASLRDAQALEAAGVSTRFDVLRAQVNLANFQQQLTTGISQQQIARRKLAQTLSLPQSVDISSAERVKIAGLWNRPLAETLVLAFKNRPELQQYLAQRNINEQQRRLALGQLGPQVSLVGRYNLGDTFDDQRNGTDNYSLGVNATLTLYDGGAAKATASQYKTGIRIAENQFALQRNQIRYDVESYFSQLQSNLQNVQTANTALEQARESLRLARLRFQAGVGTQTEVIDSENALTQAEGQRVTAILNYNRALAGLQRAVTSRAAR